MALQYLKVPPENALQILDECIVSGYQIKDKINKEYSKETINDEKLEGWRQLVFKWLNECIQKLDRVFISQKELYNFRDAQPPFGVTSEDVRWHGIIASLQARIDKLNDYDRFIHDRFNVKIEWIGRDKITQIGDNPTVTTDNKQQ